jgi:pimeloyl-ACP methyl ester carboxylesterase
MSRRQQKQGLEKILYEMDQARMRNQEIFGKPENPLAEITVTEINADTELVNDVDLDSTPQALPKLKQGSSITGFLKRFLGYTLVAIIGLHLLLGFMQRQLIYLGSTKPAGDPVNYGFAQGNVRELVIKPETGVEIAGWHVLPTGMTSEKRDWQLKEFSAEATTAKKYLAESVIIYFPGNAGHRGYRHETLKDLASLKAHVVIFDYRGYSDSSGSPSERALVKDARMIYEHVRDELKFNPERIILFGESLGGGVATQLAAELAREALPLGGLIIQSSFDSLENVAQLHYWYLAVKWLLLDKYLSIKHIPDIKCALLSIHGEQDSVIPFEMGRRLFSAAPGSSAQGIIKEFYPVPLCGHNDVREVGGAELKLKIGEFIRRVEATVK